MGDEDCTKSDRPRLRHVFSSEFQARFSDLLSYLRLTYQPRPQPEARLSRLYIALMIDSSDTSCVER